jgi:hypothetical protein
MEEYRMARLRVLFALAVFFAAVSGCNPFVGSSIEIPPDPKPILADRDAVAKCLPSDVKLSTRSWFGGIGGRWVTVEERLAEVGAHVDQDGELRDFDGKQIRIDRDIGESPYILQPEPSPEEREAQEKAQKEFDAHWRVIAVKAFDQ